MNDRVRQIKKKRETHKRMDYICVEMAGMEAQDSYLVGQGKLFAESETEARVDVHKGKATQAV